MNPLSKPNRMIYNLTLLGQIKDLTWPEVRSGSNYIKCISLEPQSPGESNAAKINALSPSVTELFRKNHFSHVFPMERSCLVPDLRSSISKIPEHILENSVGQLCDMSFNRISSPCSDLCYLKLFLRSGHLTCTGDLTWDDLTLKFSQKL